METQRKRKCHDPGFNHPPGGPFPIFLIDYTDGHYFCPAKMFRDDQAFVSYMQELYLCWELGEFPEGRTSGEMPERMANDLFILIKCWKEMERAKSFTLLGRMFSGEEQPERK